MHHGRARLIDRHSSRLQAADFLRMGFSTQAFRPTIARVASYPYFARSRPDEDPRTFNVASMTLTRDGLVFSLSFHSPCSTYQAYASCASAAESGPEPRGRSISGPMRRSTVRATWKSIQPSRFMHDASNSLNVSAVRASSSSDVHPCHRSAGSRLMPCLLFHATQFRNRETTSASSSVKAIASGRKSARSGSP